MTPAFVESLANAMNDLRAHAKEILTAKHGVRVSRSLA
jgi:hypothetical protein